MARRNQPRPAPGFECTCRLATEDDIPVLAIFERELARSAFPEDPILDLAYHEEKLRRAMRHEPEGMVVEVATGPAPGSGDEIAGWLWLSTRKTLATGERYGVLRSLYVRNQYRGRGLADDLTRYALRYFAGRGVRKIMAKVHAGNQSAIHVLRRAGFGPLHLTLEARLQPGEPFTGEIPTDGGPS